MKHVIIGTAGHVDHGKTALVKALTGIDTDRLEEEKRRGITIELGFAYLDFEDGTRAGLVDVPGHEKFIRNMLAGAGGIDLAMLIVSADEGVMPQTAEHLNILSLLGIKSGVVVLTKTDLVEDDWLDLVKSDVARFVKGTFLEGAPVVPVSAFTGAGLDILKRELRALLGAVGEKNVRVPFRLPVDRIFPVEGFGTIVTGTLVEGVVSVGDEAELLPSGLRAAVRSIQVHGEASASAGAGQRVALNLAGVRKSDLAKGDAVAKPGSLRCAGTLDVRLELLKDAARTVKNGAPLHLYHGTRAVLCKTTLLDADELQPGRWCYARLRLPEPLPCKTGDRFVVRFYSPLETIGGGVILELDPPKRRRYDTEALNALKIRESGTRAQRIHQAAVQTGRAVPAEELRRSLDMAPDEFGLELEALFSSGKLLELLPGRLVAGAVLDALASSCRELLRAYHAVSPLHAGLRVAELRQKLLGGTDLPVANAVLSELEREGVMRLTDGRAALPDFEVRLTKRQRAIRDKILELYKNAGYDTTPPDELASLFPANEKSDVAQVAESLLSSGELVALTKQIWWHRDAFERARAVAEAHFKEKRELTMPQYRDLLGTSRKYALAMLDYLDGAHVTKKTGDIRTLFKGFDVL